MEDFDELIGKLRKMSAKAQASFLKRYLMQVGPSLCRSAIRYSCQRLDEINSQCPKDSEYYKRYIENKNRRLTRKAKYAHDRGDSSHIEQPDL